MFRISAHAVPVRVVTHDLCSNVSFDFPKGTRIQADFEPHSSLAPNIGLFFRNAALAKSMTFAINAVLAAHDTYLPDGDDIASFDLSDDDHEIIPPGFVVSLGYRVTLGRVVPRAPDDATDDAQLVYARLYDEAGQSVPMPEWIRSRLPLDRYEAAAIESVRDGLALRPAAAE